MESFVLSRDYPVMVLGGYGNFGARISTSLAKAGIPVIIAGRSLEKASTLAATLPQHLVSTAIFDVTQSLPEQLEQHKPAIVIHTVGPFQTSDYSIARTCITHGVHYIDLADARTFVTGITTLDSEAKKAGISIISGASTVPGLSSAVLEKYKGAFSEIDTLTYGISPGQKASRGLATAEGILTYVGKPLTPAYGTSETRYGWQDIYRQPFPELGKRWMANCDIPDLDVLPERYGIQSIRFSAGMESTLAHLGIWALSWLVRLGIPLHLPRHARALLKASHWLDWLGTENGGMFMRIQGKRINGESHSITWYIIAKNGDGPHIPTIPAILLAKKLAMGGPLPTGAMPCVAMVPLDDYLNALSGYAIKEYLYQE
ncbi:MAG: saccharopine dehydrogenase NADP-binding domain-containing protein [Hyphomicrobiales bacterium]|nr:saccharopine dehydrogenase NADP-binding domain-containing protein [Hyphomicrobiales bacterium]